MNSAGKYFYATKQTSRTSGTSSQGRKVEPGHHQQEQKPHAHEYNCKQLCSSVKIKKEVYPSETKYDCEWDTLASKSIFWGCGFNVNVVFPNT